MSSDGNRMLLERRWTEHPELENALAQSRTQRGAQSEERDARRLYINLLKRAVSGLTPFEPDTAVAMTHGGNIEAAPLAEARMIDRRWDSTGQGMQ
jgi:hypothetical protein